MMDLEKTFIIFLMFSLFIIPATAELIPLDVSRDLTESTDQNYAYMNQNPFFTVYYGDDPSSGNVVKFTSGGVEMTLLPMALNYNNDLSQLEQISMPQSVSPTVSGSEITYTNAYGTNIDLVYETQKDKVKEKLTINSPSALPNPAQYVIDGGNVQLEFGFQLASDGKIYLDGVEWDESSEVSTTNDVLVKDSNDNLVYTLPRPFAIDSNSQTVFGHYVFKKSATKLYVRIYIPYSWLNDSSRIYPIVIDPTFTVDYSPIPASHLINGLTTSEPDFDFDSVFDITSDMSDSSDSTVANTYINSLLEFPDLAVSYKFEETSGNLIQDDIGGIPLNLSGSPNLNIGGISGSGIQFDGVNDYGIRDELQNTSASEDIVVCVALSDSGIASSEKLIDNKAGGNAQGVELTLTSSDTIDFFVRRGATQTTLNGVSLLDDTLWHTVCGVSLANGTIQIWIDGVLEDSAIGVTGAMLSETLWYVGQDQTGGSKFSQKMDELCAWRDVGVNENLIVQQYNSTYCGNVDGIAISGKWNQTYESEFDWFLRVKKETSTTTTISVLGYNSTDYIAVGQETSQILTGIGWFNIPVDSILNYEKNTANLNFSILRLFTDIEINFSEILLRKEVNDTVVPTISDCQVNTSTIGCLETAFLRCNVTDDVDIQSVNFTLNNVTYNAVMYNDFWDYIFDPTDTDGSVLYDWEQANATDLAGNSNTTDPNLQINYTCNYAEYINIIHVGINGTDQFNITSNSAVIYWTTSNLSNSRVDYGTTTGVYTDFESDATYVLDHYVTLTGLNSSTTYFYSVTSVANPNQTLSEFNFTTISSCIENWVEDTIVCLINDTYLSTYTDSNACGTIDNLPVTNGTYQSCNYCSEDLVQILGSCTTEGNQTVEYIDNNYFSCCAVTGLITDCSVDSIPPFNETTSQSCLFFSNTMGNISCQNEPNFRLREKEYCLAYIPINFSNESFKCISHVTKISTDEILQTNPEYRERASSLLDWKHDPETRQYFSTANSIVNFYYTNKNLYPEEDYALIIECSSPLRTLSSGLVFQMAYEDYEFVFFRTKWVMANAGYIIGGIILLFAIIFILAILYRNMI